MPLRDTRDLLPIYRNHTYGDRRTPPLLQNFPAFIAKHWLNDSHTPRQEKKKLENSTEPVK